MAKDTQPVEVTGSKVEVVTWNPSNFLPGTSSGTWSMRDTTQRFLYIPHQNAGLYEQVIAVKHTLNADLNIKVRTTFNWGEGDKNGPDLFSGVMPAGDSRFIFTSERSASIVDSAIMKSIELIELRLPYAQFMFELQAATAPTSGDLRIQSVRRY